MRCKLCSTPHKNTNRYKSWNESQVCRTCSCVLEFFSWNSNYLHEYWKGGEEYLPFLDQEIERLQEKIRRKN